MTLNDMIEFLEKNKYPRKLYVCRQDFESLWNAQPPAARYYHDEVPTVTIWGTQIIRKDWPTDRPEEMDCSTGSIFNGAV